MKIYLKNRYRGARTNEQWLAYGEHDANELPNGLAQYLVDNGHATVIDDSDNGREHSSAVAEKLMTGQLENEDEPVEFEPIPRTRADKTLTPHDVETMTPEVSVFDELKEEYEALAGEAPPWNIKLETLRARVEELRDED